jgi:outer membrane protein assembly factor BamB
MPTIPTQPFDRRLRLWPGLLIAGLVILVRFLLPLLFADLAMVGLLGAVAGLAAILVWWLFFSRAPWTERIAAPVLMLVAAAIVWPFLHPSITGGMMGMMFGIYALPPVLGPALVGWAALSRSLQPASRWATMALTILAATALWTLLRTDGLMGAGSQVTWRWAPTAEERLLARDAEFAPSVPAVGEAAPALEPTRPQSDAVTTAAAATEAAPADASAGEEPVAKAPATAAEPASSASAGKAGHAAREDEVTAAAPAADAGTAPSPAAWPGFRGPRRDGIVRGVRIATDWATEPPIEVWRRPVGPGWSSFAVSGDLLYTQEQRGDDELVSCYRLATGEPVWAHRDPVRFYESNGGAGPRGTPTLSGGRVYAFGATGILNALDARTGALAWSHDVAADTGTTVPEWGFASSPLVVGRDVIVAASGTLAAYDASSGARRWTAPAQGGSYSSPQLATIDNVRQVLLLTSTGATSVDPATGQVLWQAPWPGGGTTIVQPALLPDGDILINGIAATGGLGLRRLSIEHAGDGWRVAERWTSRGLKPYFNDFVVAGNDAFGFDGNILSSIGLDDGERRWKGGRYGNGQMILLADQNVLLVLSEDGELALVSATPDGYREIDHVAALNAKTWNHPALVGDLLLVRNGEEMAAFRLRAAR